MIAKVTRDRLMVEMHDVWPHYDFRTHKGYCTAEHDAALAEHGPCPQHRMRFVNVRRAAGLEPLADLSATSVGSAGVGEQSGTTPGTEEDG